MLEKVVLVFCVLLSQGYAQSCPLWQCGSGNSYGETLDLQACLAQINETEKCIQDSLTEGDACQTCDKVNINQYTRPASLRGKTWRKCYGRQCRKGELFMCSMWSLYPVVLFQDTTKIDSIISCVDAWNPGMDGSTCLYGMLGVYTPLPIDLVDQTKKILNDMKSGCDPVLPLAQCRKHLIPFIGEASRPFYAAVTVDIARKAIGDTYTCVQTALKKYPCKTLESLLADQRVRETFVNATVLLATYKRGSGYATYCGGAR